MRSPWIGLVHVKPGVSCTTLGTAAGAYANPLAWASSAEEWKFAVEAYFLDEDLHVIEVEDVEPLVERLSAGDPDPDLVASARSLSDDQRVVVDRFDTYADVEDAS